MDNGWYSKAIKKEAQNAPSEAVPMVPSTGDPATPLQSEQVSSNTDVDEKITSFRAVVMQEIMPSFITGLSESTMKSVNEFSQVIVTKMEDMGINGQQEDVYITLLGMTKEIATEVMSTGGKNILNKMTQSQEAGIIIDQWFTQLENGMGAQEEQTKTTRQTTETTQVSPGGAPAPQVGAPGQQIPQMQGVPQGAGGEIPAVI